MKNKILVLILVILIAIPQVTFAAWWNPVSWFERIISFFNQPKIEQSISSQEEEDKNISTTTIPSLDDQNKIEGNQIKEKTEVQKTEETRLKNEARVAELRLKQQQEEAERIAREKEAATKKQAEILAQAAQIANQATKTRTLELISDILLKLNQLLTDTEQEIAKSNTNLDSTANRADSASQTFRTLTINYLGGLTFSKPGLQQVINNKKAEKSKFEQNSLESFVNFDPDTNFKETLSLLASLRSQFESQKAEYQGYFNTYLNNLSAATQVQQQNNYSTNTVPKGTYCNGTYYSSCPASYDFICPASGGSAYCQPTTPPVDTALLEKCQAIMNRTVSTTIIIGELRAAGCPGY